MYQRKTDIGVALKYANPAAVCRNRNGMFTCDNDSRTEAMVSAKDPSVCHRIIMLLYALE